MKKPQPAPDKKNSDSSPAGKDTLRETIESVVVAFILAFLFRTFEAEAFVIPTGSMAPTLLGRHKDVTCDQCGFEYNIGASDEVDNDNNSLLRRRIDTAYCPNCRYQQTIRGEPVFKGDRILVNKFPYEFGEPERFDVIVFKYPEDPQTNYIKRLIGLPGETIKIERGDVYARQGEIGDFEILRKADPDKQRDLQILVYDDDHPSAELLALGWPERWQPVKQSGGPEGVAGWVEDEFGWEHNATQRAFSLATGDRWSWLRYRHIVPSRVDWHAVKQAQPLTVPRPQLISDYCGYNSYSPSQGMGPEANMFWVGDLTLSATVEVLEAGEGSELQIEVNEGVRLYRCRIDLQTGVATLTHNNEVDPDGPLIELASAQTELAGPGTYSICFANVDDRLCLWVDDRLVDFGDDAVFKAPSLPNPQPQDLIPVGLASRRAALDVSHLRLERDIYYRAERVRNDDNGRMQASEEYEGSASMLRDLLHEPEEWGRKYTTASRIVQFETLGPDEFFVMGDNSPRSRDSRLWSNTRRAENRHAVPRAALVGKAFFVYWPHGIPFLNNGKGYALNFWPVRRFFYHQVANNAVDNYPCFTIPFYPQFGRMHRIR